MSTLASIGDVTHAEGVLKEFLTPTPLIRSTALEQTLGLPPSQRVWIKDFGWSPVGSFKVMGALNWVARNAESLANRPIIASSSGNFASGIAFAARLFQKKLFVIMPDDAPRVKFERTANQGAEIVTYDKSQDHITGDRERLSRDLARDEKGIFASPYNDRYVIAGNGVAGLEIVNDLKRQERKPTRLYCPISGGGLLAGLALAIRHHSPECKITGVEPELANDFSQSLASGKVVSIEHPQSICDGLLSYEVGDQNWQLLQRNVENVATIPDSQTIAAMKWLYDNHGLRTEPSGAIAVAALLNQQESFPDEEGDIVVIISGRNVDEDLFRDWISQAS
ncbi:L-threonine dehydratase catabolic TdcB [Thalassoglobus neptunius]|uniref:L-threonine dehydratase catabolic TdcB n=1 Tax=Thalassoglobus neptunius TaxID=1938619 RepID=A0A5C5X797_9PLAN|nr:threonine/serine dehydratase [Thalassoglobus neptunius]TWT58133.1 L-threonine dehydratase catabolic TdcB [Thalassoglobus neptunius]